MGSGIGVSVGRGADGFVASLTLVGVNVSVGLGVSVEVGVDVAVGVEVGVGVDEGVRVGVNVGTNVGVGRLDEAGAAGVLAEEFPRGLNSMLKNGFEIPDSANTMTVTIARRHITTNPIVTPLLRSRQERLSIVILLHPLGER